MTDADLAAIYLATHLTVEHDGELRALREIDLDAGATLHVITAWNPGDERPGVHASAGRSRPRGPCVGARHGADHARVRDR